MASHGYIPYLQDRLAKLQRGPYVLEIGIDRGVMTIPLAVALASSHDSFFYMAIDINIQESVSLILRNLGKMLLSSVFLMHGNSLELLPKLSEQDVKFDLVLLDGDHNYHTVSNELQIIGNLVNDDGIIVVDDYDGKWSTRDLWYSTRDGYENNPQATQPVATQKHGVKPAVDDWLEKNPGWKIYKPIPDGEPVILSRQPI